MPALLPVPERRPPAVGSAARTAALALSLVVLPALLIGGTLLVKRRATDSVVNFTITAAPQPVETQARRRVVSRGPAAGR